MSLSVCSLAFQLELAFENNQIPSFDKMLIPIMYSRSDDEPLAFLSQVYPFDEISEEKEFPIDEIILHLSNEGRVFLFPKLFQYFLNSPDRRSYNLFSSVDGLLYDYQFARPKRPTRDWLASMTVVQLSVIEEVTFELFGLKKANVA